MAILPQPYNTRLEAISRTTENGFLTLVGGVLTLAASSGVGNVSGPASSTVNAIPVYADGTGKVLNSSPATIESNGSFNLTINNSRKAVISYSGTEAAFHLGTTTDHDLFRILKSSGTWRIGSRENTDTYITANNSTRAIFKTTGPAIITDGVQLNTVSGPILKNTGIVVNFRNAADTADASLTARAGTFSDIINSNGLNVTNASDITSTTNQLNITNNSSAVSGGAALRATNNLGSSITVAMYGGGHSASHLANKGCVNSQVGLRLVSDSGVTTGGINDIEISPGGHNRLSATFFAEGGLTLNRGGVKSATYQVNNGVVSRNYASVTDGDFWSLRTSDLSGYGKAILGSGTRIAGSETGSSASPGHNRLVFVGSSMAIENHETNGSSSVDAIIDVLNYKTNATHRDLVMWANPTGLVKDLSNFTMDFVLRGLTGDVEIKRGRLIADNDIQVGGATGPRIRNNGFVFNLRNSTDTADAGITAGAGTFNGNLVVNGAINGSGGLSLTSSQWFTNAASIVGISSNNTSTSAGIQFRGTVANGLAGGIQISHDTYSSASISNRTNVFSTGVLKLVSDRNTISGGTSDIIFSPGGTASDSVIMPAAGGLDILRGRLTGKKGFTFESSGAVSHDASMFMLKNTRTSIADGGIRFRLENGTGEQLTLMMVNEVYGSEGHHYRNRAFMFSTRSIRLCCPSSQAIEISTDNTNSVTAWFDNNGFTSTKPVTQGFQTITDDSEVTTTVLTDGQSRLFYNSTSDTLSTWTNVGGKLYKSQPHVEV